MTALDDGNLTLEKFQKMEKDAQVMIKILTRNMELEEMMKKKQMKSKDQDKPKKPKLSHQKFVSDSLGFDYTPAEGRFAKACKDIKLGENLIQEKPHVSVLLQKYCQTNCQHCFKRTSIPIACSLCADVIFCSEACRSEATDTYHKFECGVLPHLWNSGASITCLMALRIITQKSEKYFLNIQEDLDKQKGNKDFSEIDK